MIHLIDKYWDLTPDERRQVEQFVSEHPELRDRLHEARLLAEMIDDAGEDFAEEDLARYVSREILGDVAGVSDAEAGTIKSAIDEDSDLRTLAEQYGKRAAELASHDPRAHFESIQETPGASGPPRRPRNSRMRKLRAPNRRSRPVRRLAVAAVLALLALTVSVTVLQLATMSRLDRLAAFQQDEVERGHYQFTTRGAAAAVAEADTLFLDALDLLKSAQRSYLGIFQSYDSEMLVSAEGKLRQYVEEIDDETFLSLEARYLLAKVMIHEGRLRGAASELETVIEEGGARTGRARELLAELERRR